MALGSLVYDSGAISFAATATWSPEYGGYVFSTGGSVAPEGSWGGLVSGSLGAVPAGYSYAGTAGFSVHGTLTITCAAGTVFCPDARLSAFEPQGSLYYAWGVQQNHYVHGGFACPCAFGTCAGSMITPYSYGGNPDGSGLGKYGWPPSAAWLAARAGTTFSTFVGCSLGVYTYLWNPYGGPAYPGSAQSPIVYSVTGAHCHLVIYLTRPDQTGAGAMSMDVGRHRRHVLAHSSGGSVHIGIATESIGTAWAWRDTGIGGYSPSVRWERADVWNRIYLAYCTGGNIIRQWSDDEGASWGMAGTVGAGTAPTYCITPDGRHWVYYLAGSAIKGACYDGAGGTIIAPVTVIGTADVDAIACADHVTQGNRWRMNLAYRFGGTLITKTSIDGTAFV